MGNLFTQLNDQRATGGFVMNQMRTGSVALADPLTKSQGYRVDYGMATAGTESVQDHWAVGLVKTALAAPVDVADTLASLVPGIERGSINDSFYDSIGMPGYAQWVRENHGGVEIASGILGAVATGFAAEVGAAKLLGSAWFAATSAGKALSPIINVASRAQMAAARSTLAAAKEGQTLGWLQGANRTYLLSKAGVGLAKAGVSEVAVIAALHNNSAIWSDDMQTNALFTGLGLGLGAVGGVIGGRAFLSKWANRETVKNAMVDAADPGGYARMLADAPMGIKEADGLSTLRGPVKTAEFTALMLSATRDDAEAAARLGTPKAGVTRPAIQTGEQREALKVAQTFTSKGIGEMPETKFGVNGSNAGVHFQEATREDPTLFLGASEVGSLAHGTPMKAWLKERADKLQAILDNPFAKREEKILARMRTEEHPLFVIGKTLMGAEDAQYLTDYVPLESSAFRPTTKGVKQIQFKAPNSGKKIMLNEDGSMTAKWEDLNVHDQLAVVDGMNHMLKQIGPMARITLPKTPTFMQIDFALAHAERGGIVDFTTNLKAMDLDELRVISLQKKFEKALELKTLGKPLDLKARLSLNLPLPSTLERVADPDGIAYFNWMKQSKVAGATVSVLQEARVNMVRATDIATDATISSKLDGDIFNFNRIQHGSRKGEWAQPLVATFADPSKTKYSRFDLGDLVTEQKALSAKVMMTKKSAPFTASIATAIMENPGYRAISDMYGLSDSQIGGTKSVVGAVGSQMLTQAMRFRHNITLQAAQGLRRVVNRMTEIHLDDVLKRLSPHVESLTAVSGQRSRVLLNNYMTFSPGWDLDKVVQGADGFFQFSLAKTERNAARLGREVGDDDVLMTPQGVPVALDDVADAARQSLEKEYTQLLKERNSVRQARGLESIKQKPFYVPPPSTKGKIMGFTLDAANRVVPGGTVLADTREAFDQLRTRVTAKLQPGERFVTESEVKDFTDLWEQAQMDWVNPLEFIDPQSLAGKAGEQLGKLASAYVNPRGFEEALEYIKHGYEQTTTGAVKAMFDGQLRLARLRGTAQQVVEGQAWGTQNIWETYGDTLLGIAASAKPRGINKVLSQVDSFVDNTMASIWNPLQVSGQHVKDVFDKLGRTEVKASTRTFTALADELGPYMPFATATEYAEYKYGIKAPWTSKDVARAVNRIGSGVILRWLEMPHAVMNMAGILTNLPVIMTAQNVPTVGRVGKIGVIDSTKIMSRGFKRQFERGTADWDMMVRNGDTTQDVAELHHQLSLLDGKSAFMKFMTGNPNGKTMIERKGLEGMASIIADTSENMSRRWAHFVGLELADYHGITGMEARHNFARQIANDTIANYDPLNRPELFQSAFGSMYGLFLSYAQNYYERMFRYMEAGEYKAVGKQMALQASMFGFTGVPGFRQVAALIGGEDSGDDPVSGIYQRFGPALGNVVAHGGFNQLVTLFGLPPVALHTRGDANFRHPAADFATGVPALPVGLEVLKDVVGGVFDAAWNWMGPNGNPRYAAETLARNMPSRMLRGALSVLALNGQEADAYGNLMSENQNAFETAYRMLGLRSERQAAEIEMYFLNQKSKAIDANQMQGVRAASRALIRAGNYEALPGVFKSYIDAGGKPWNYGEWLKGMIKEAQQTRGENQLYQTMKSPGHEVLMNRLRMVTAPY